MTALFVRNTHPTARVMVPLGTGGRARLLLPSTTSCMPAGVVELPAVRRMLAAQVLAVVDSAGWDADARQRQADRLGMQELIRAAEQREFDRYRQRHRIARRVPALPGSSGHHAGRWPAEKNARFKAHWEADTPLADLVAEFGVTDKSSIVHKAKRLGLAARGHPEGWPAEQVERLRTLRAAGAGLSLIAAELGRSHEAVANKLCRLARQKPAQAGLEGPAFAQRTRQDGAQALGRGATATP